MRPTLCRWSFVLSDGGWVLHSHQASKGWSTRCTNVRPCCRYTLHDTSLFVVRRSPNWSIIVRICVARHERLPQNRSVYHEPVPLLAFPHISSLRCSPCRCWLIRINNFVVFIALLFYYYTWITHKKIISSKRQFKTKLLYQKKNKSWKKRKYTRLNPRYYAYLGPFLPRIYNFLHNIFKTNVF